MLVLSRKKNQVIHIGNCVEVKVLSMKGGRVQIGIVAPQDVRIVRSEIDDADAYALASDWIAIEDDFGCVIEDNMRRLSAHGVKPSEPAEQTV